MTRKSPLWYATIGHSRYVFLEADSSILGSTRELDAVWYLAREYAEKINGRVSIYNRDNDELVMFVDPRH